MTGVLRPLVGVPVVLAAVNDGFPRNRFPRVCRAQSDNTPRRWLPNPNKDEWEGTGRKDPLPVFPTPSKSPWTSAYFVPSISSHGVPRLRTPIIPGVQTNKLRIQVRTLKPRLRQAMRAQYVVWQGAAVIFANPLLSAQKSKPRLQTYKRMPGVRSL